MMANKLRVGLVTPGTQPALADVESRILAKRGGVSLLYQVLLNSEPIASGWERILTAVRNETTVPPAIRELIILRVAVLNGASFEFEAHVPIAMREGVGENKIAAVSQTTITDTFDSDERLILELTDAMTRSVVVDDGLITRLKQHYGDESLVELVATVAAYNMVSRFLVALNISH